MLDSLSFQLFPSEPIAVVSNVFTLSDLSELRDENSVTGDRVVFLKWLCRNGFDLDGRRISSSDRHCARMLMEPIQIFASIQSLMKMHPLFDIAIVQLLLRNKSSVVILLRNTKQLQWQLQWQQRMSHLIDQLKSNKYTSNIDISSRIIFLDPMKHVLYASVLCQVDVVLDPFPFGGGVTMCDAVVGGCSRRSSESATVQNTSIPFVTSSTLQSVHRIAAGLASEFQDPTIAVNSDIFWDFSKWFSTIVSSRRLVSPQSTFSIFILSLIDEYVSTAIYLANDSQSRESTATVKRHPGKSPYFSIYDNLELVSMEWLTLMRRMVAMLD
jgi:hypothetical protein